MIWLQEKQVVSWAYQIISGVGRLHEKKIVHRDLKMANILVDKKGYLKICDFGLCKKFQKEDDYTTSCCGTATTWAPEVIKEEKYRMMPDWWSVGIILFQFMNKKTPFDEPKMENTNNLDKSAWKKQQSKINNDRICEAEWKWYNESKNYCDELKDLVNQLLTRDPKTRIGCNDDAQEILAHPVFKKYEAHIKKVKECQYEHPILPDVYDTNQDFENYKHKDQIQKAFDCFDHVNLAAIKKGNEEEKFKDSIFGENGLETTMS